MKADDFAAGRRTEEGRRDFLSDVLDVVIEHATSARELCEVGVYREGRLRLELLLGLVALRLALDELGKA